MLTFLHFYILSNLFMSFCGRNFPSLFLSFCLLYLFIAEFSAIFIGRYSIISQFTFMQCKLYTYLDTRQEISEERSLQISSFCGTHILQRKTKTFSQLQEALKKQNPILGWKVPLSRELMNISLVENHSQVGTFSPNCLHEVFFLHITGLDSNWEAKLWERYYHILTCLREKKWLCNKKSVMLT